METYFLDLPDINTGKITRWVFPVVDEPTDTEMMQATRRMQLERATKMMDNYGKGRRNAEVHREAS